MKTFLKPILSVALFLMVFTNPLFSVAKGKHEKGVEYTYTSSRLSPKQFTRGYYAEKKQYSHDLDQSTRKMLRKRHGTWIQRFLSRKRH